MKKVRKAVFPVAGLGTRFLPATKANPKEMLPIVDKPLIQYAAEEAVNAGIDTLIFIIGRNKRAIPDHFDKAYELESELEASGKLDRLAEVQHILPPEISCIYIRQSEALGLGHAVLCSKSVVGDEPFAIILADDLIDGGDKSCLQQMVDVYEKEQSGVIGVQKVPLEDVKNYGVVAGQNTKDRLWKLSGLVEKPKPEDAPSNVAVVGRYILESSIFEMLEETQPGSGGEIQLTDAIVKQLQQESVYAYEFEGRRYDCGSKLGYLQATLEYGLKHPEVGAAFKAYLKKMDCFK
ncbi:MAG: UTP--glucose-1-phosphate uridylyltransferase GalU [Gammaproteobacteria bacterium]|nr:UTP--glucose-1-phosphate uridylyltransferase GalU [Gammaproteobacteria bacterium]